MNLSIISRTFGDRDYIIKLQIPENERKVRGRMEKVRFWLTGDVARLWEGTRQVCDRLDALLDADGVVIQAKKSDSLEVCREDGVMTIGYGCTDAYDGDNYVTLKANAIGNANIKITLPNSESVVTEAIVSPYSDEKITFCDVTFGDNSASVTLTSNQSDAGSGTLIFAEYDKDGRLLSVKCKDFDTTSNKIVSFDNLTRESEHYNIFALDSLSSLSPLCEKY